jgi:uncharacterized protein (DUF58 family)
MKLRIRSARDAVLSMRPPIAASSEAVLGRRQLYMLPTRHGILFGMVLFVMLLAGINYENGLVYGLTFLLSGMAVVSMLYTHRNLLNLHIAAGPCAPVFAGERAMFQVCLDNPGPDARLEVAVEHAGARAATVDIHAGGQCMVAIEVPTRRRGWLAMPDVGVSTQFPVGLFYSWSRRVRIDHHCLVYPRPAEQQPLRTRGDEEGKRNAGLRPEGDDFIGVRDYQRGDSPRHVDWKAVARGQPWQTKRFGGDRRESVWLDWEALDGMDTETRLGILCRWVLDAESGGLLYGLRLPGRSIVPGTGADHRHQCLEALALFEAQP